MLVRSVLGRSPIHGFGVFAKDFIPRGAPVWCFTPCFDVLLPPAFVAELRNWDYVQRYAEQCPITGYYLLAADDARFMNHADEPNVSSHVPLLDPGRVDCALRDVEPGEELTCDYRVNGTAPHPAR